MPKMKTHSSAKKRFRFTGTGKIKRNHSEKGHLLTKKSKSRKKRLLKATLVKKCNEKRIKLLLCK